MTVRDRPGALGPRAIGAWALAAVALLVLLQAWQRNAYWEYSDGVYALTSRLFLHGGDLYGEIAAAQPPPIFLFGALALALDDSPGFLRAAVAAVQLTTSALVLVAVWRLTRSRAGAVTAALVLLVAPWSLREHAQLIPETFAAPLLLGAALALARGGGGRTPLAAGKAPTGTVPAAAMESQGGNRAVLLAGALGALAAAFKVAFALPAVVLLVAGTRDRGDRIRGLLAFAGAGAALGIASLLAFGGPLLDGAVRAQQETGLAALGYVGGLWAQAGWNLVPLLVCAGLAWPLRARLADPVLARCLAAAAVGTLLLLATLFKSGSYLTVLVAIEPPLVCLGAAGVVAAWRAWRETGASEARAAGASATAGASAAIANAAGAGAATGASASAAGRGVARGRAGAFARWPLALAAAALLLGVVQVGSLLAAPADPRPFTRPFAASGPGWTLSPDAVDDAVAQIRACSADVATSGPPYLAFVAGRRIAGDQPDQFILASAPVLGEQRARAEADQPRCP